MTFGYGARSQQEALALLARYGIAYVIDLRSVPWSRYRPEFSRTRMNQGRVCVGGHDLDQDFRSLRLLTKGGMNIKEAAEIDVGEIWQLDYEDHAEPDPPPWEGQVSVHRR